MLNVARPVNFWWYSPEVSKKIVSLFLEAGAGAFLRFEPYISEDGVPKLDWAIVGGQAVAGGDPPGGNESQTCPPPPCP